MSDILVLLQSASWEWLAVALSLAYLLLAMRENPWCWPAAFISTALYVVIFWHVALLMDALLNVYYMAMAVYGGWLWTRRKSKKNHFDVDAMRIHRWSWQRHVLAIVVVIAASLISGATLERFTNAAWPYLDSFTTWGSVVTTYMVARKVLENWLYWIIIDSVALGLYLERGLYPTAALFAVYLVLCVLGFLEWRRRFAERNSELHPTELQIADGS